jgi:hypothetical protein
MMPVNGSSFGRTGGFPRRNREGQHLRYCPWVDAKPPRRLPTAQPLDTDRPSNPCVKLHALRPPPLPTGQNAIACRTFTPAQLDTPAAAARDFLSGAYTAGHSLCL